VHHRNVPLAPMSQYVRSTVLKGVQQLKPARSLSSETQPRSTSQKSEIEKD
jgi:hypothetical protein